MGMTKRERIGTRGINNFGTNMEIVDYKSSDDVLVQFEQGNFIHTNWKAFLKGEVKNPYDRTVHGIGFIGEGKHTPSKNRKMTHKYMVWNDMLRRCYSKKWHDKYPSYKNCSVIDQWHNFQNFGDWYDDNFYEIEGEKIHLDKDILIKGNKIYSPDTCVFVPQRINILFLKRESDRGEFPIGVSWNKQNKKYVASYGKGKRESEYIGLYPTIEEAFYAYKLNKEIYVKEIADEYKSIIPMKLYEAMIRYQVELED